MPPVITTLPDGPDTAGLPAADGGRLQAAQNLISGLLDLVPNWIWVALVTAIFIGTLATIPGLRRQARKAGERAATKEPLSADARKDRKLLIGALIPATLFWAAVLIGSGRGLIAFGRDDLNWTGGWEYLIPLTLDGVAISFGLLAFRSVHKNQNPDRATHIAWGAMVVSAALNFFHEFGGSSLGAAYLAILSLFGMLIFHEFLAQFEEGAAYIKRDKPKFGLRWITWPSNTACAWVAWRNHPPEVADDTRVTIRMAVANLDTVRVGKARERAAKVDQPSLIERINPLLRARQLKTALTDLRAVTAVKTADVSALTGRLETALTDLTAARVDLTAMVTKVDAVSAENVTVKTSLQALTEQAVKERDDLTATLAADKEKALRALTDRLTAQFTARLEEVSTVSITKYRDSHPKGSPVKPKQTSPQGGNKPAVSDETAVQMMLTAHRDANFEWSQNAVRTLTGAGFPRIPKLITAWHAAAVNAATGDLTGESKAVNQ